jgi:multiple sugar transport system substrate-binding protein
MKGKRIRFLALGIALAMTLASSLAFAQDKKVKLTWSMWGADTDREAWSAIAKMVTKKYPNIEIELQIADWNTYWQKLQTQIASGNAADIFGIQSSGTNSYQNYALRGAFAPLQKYIDADTSIDLNDFTPGVLDGYKLDGKIGALPYDFGPPIYFYNKDAFDKYKVPYPKTNWTWDDFLAKAKALTQPKDKIFGFGMMANVFWTQPFILSNGGSYVDAAKNEVSINNAGATKALQWCADFINVSKASPTVAEQGAMTSFDRWFAGGLAMKVDGPWDLMNSKARCKFRFGVAPVPMSASGKRTATLSGSGFGVYAKSKHQEEAYKAIAVITGPEALALLASQGRAFPSRLSQQEVFYKAAEIDGLKEAMVAQLKDIANIPDPVAAGDAYTFIENNCLQPAFSGQGKVAAIVAKYDGQVRKLSRGE